jgi:hypothetical protein
MKYLTPYRQNETSLSPVRGEGWCIGMFTFIWKRTDNLDRLVEKLNNFEAVNIIREPEKLVVK